MSNIHSQYKCMQPWLKRKKPPEVLGKVVLQSKENRAKLDGMYECILRACCCTPFSRYCWNPEDNLGLAALLDANRVSIG